jgi:hypothetical protein
LRHIGDLAFLGSPLEKTVVPAGVREIDPFAFSDDVWRSFTWDVFTAIDHFLLSADSTVLLSCFASNDTITIPAHIEVIRRRAFRFHRDPDVRCESGTKLRELGDEAFSGCGRLESLSVPASVETIGERCFDECPELATIGFEEPSQLLQDQDWSQSQFQHRWRKSMDLHLLAVRS